MHRHAARLFLGLALLLVFVCTGCSGGSVISETRTAQSFSLSSEHLSDAREISISVGDSASATLNASVTQKHGSLSILITDTAGDIIYSGNDIASATTFTLLLEGPADYTIQLDLSQFTGSAELLWETVGASVGEPAPQAAVPRDPSTDEEASDAEPTLSNDMVITNTQQPAADSAGDPTTEIPDWNGHFLNTDTGVALDLFWADNNTVEFQISGNGSVGTATARIDGAQPSYAEYVYDEMTLSFQLTGSSLIVTQTGTCSLVPESIAGEYLLSADEAEE